MTLEPAKSEPMAAVNSVAYCRTPIFIAFVALLFEELQKMWLKKTKIIQYAIMIG